MIGNILSFICGVVVGFLIGKKIIRWIFKKI